MVSGSTAMAAFCAAAVPRPTNIPIRIYYPGNRPAAFGGAPLPLSLLLPSRLRIESHERTKILPGVYRGGFVTPGLFKPLSSTAFRSNCCRAGAFLALRLKPFLQVPEAIPKMMKKIVPTMKRRPQPFWEI